MVANSAYVEFNLLKASIFEITNKIKTLSLLMLTPLPLDYKRQEYLYQNIRPFVKDEFKDITCPKPVRTVNDIFLIQLTTVFTFCLSLSLFTQVEQ